MAIFLHSTYKDNPFLTKGIIAKLESYNPYEVGVTEVIDGVVCWKNMAVDEKNQPPPNVLNIKNGTADKYLYEVYCLGLGSEKPNRIYKNWTRCTDEFFKELPYERYYGLDFGISSPTAVVEVCFDGDKTFYIKELLYKPSKEMGMTIGEYLQLINKAGKTLIDIDNTLVADSAKKSMVIDLVNSGIRAIPAIKGAGSVSRNISLIQSFKIVYTASSINLEEEYLNYSWKIDRYGLVEEKPADNQSDHLMNAAEYIIAWLVTYLGIR